MDLQKYWPNLKVKITNFDNKKPIEAQKIEAVSQN